MKLRDWIDTHPRDQRRTVRARLARKLKISESMVRHLANGTRRITAEHAIAIEQATRCQVARTDSRPDLFDQQDQARPPQRPAVSQTTPLARTSNNRDA